MNREIKLRAWCPKNKEMYYADNCRNYENGGYYFDIDNNSIGFYPRYNTDELSRFNTKPSDNEIEILVMKSIGFKDGYGKEIYEGDLILSDGGLIVYAKWDDLNCRFIWANDLGFEALIGKGDNNSNTVIGNIYENPELLK